MLDCCLVSYVAFMFMFWGYQCTYPADLAGFLSGFLAYFAAFVFWQTSHNPPSCRETSPHPGAVNSMKHYLYIASFIQTVKARRAEIKNQTT